MGVCAVSLAATGCSDDDGETSSNAAVEDESLFVQTARSGSFRDGELRLDEVSPVTTSFSERPGRRRGSLSTADFSDRFAELFGDEPPNASVSSLERSKGEFVVELSEPRYRPVRRQLVYTVKAVGGRNADLPAKVGPVSVFIDSGGPTVSIYGTVLADDGDLIPGATVVLMPLSAGGDPMASVADPNGNYSFDAVQDPGEYELTTSFDGFQTVTKAAELRLDDNGEVIPIEVDFALRPTDEIG